VRRLRMRRWLALPMAVLTLLAMLPSGALAASAVSVGSGTSASTTAKALLSGAPNQVKAAAKLTLHVLDNSSGHAIATNTARARATCDGCIAAAVSIQIVLVTSGDVRTNNRAYSTNDDCDGCVGLAVARQIVITVDGAGSFTSTARQRLASLRAELANINYRRTSPEELEDKVDGLANRMARVVLDGFVGATGSAVPEELCGVGTDDGGCVGAPTVRGIKLGGLASGATFDARGKNLAHSFQRGTTNAVTAADSRQLVLADPSMRLRTEATPASFTNEAVNSTVGLGIAPALIDDGDLDFEGALDSLEDCVASPASCAEPMNVGSVIYSQANQWLFGSLPTSFGRNEARSLLIGDEPATLPETETLSASERRDAYRTAVREARTPDLQRRPRADGPTVASSATLGDADSARSARLPFVGQGVAPSGVASGRSLGAAIALQYTLAPPGAGCQDVAASQVPIGDVVSIPGSDRVIVCASNNLSGATVVNSNSGTYDNAAVAQTARLVGTPDALSEGPVALILNSRNADGVLGAHLGAGGGATTCDVDSEGCSVLAAQVNTQSEILTSADAQVVAPASLDTLVRSSQLEQTSVLVSALSNGTNSTLMSEQETSTIGHPLSAPAANEYTNEALSQIAVVVSAESYNDAFSVTQSMSTTTID
jgi:hypothetical protein